MLYDKRWDAKTKADPLTLDALIAWLEPMSRRGTYDFTDHCGECLIGQYMAHLGIPWSMGEYRNVVISIFGNEGHVEAYGVLVEGPWTFGDALKRARALRQRC
jgi:hypothetical protein